jgi:hypothetical protein
MYMGKRIIITETQLSNIKKVISENNHHQILVKELVKDLDMNYEPMLGIMRENGEYVENPMIKIKVDERSITPYELYEYFKKKYNLGESFIKQVISDWVFGRIKDGMLSKNVPIN